MGESVRGRRSQWYVGALVAVLLLAGCSRAASEPEASASPSEEPTEETVEDPEGLDKSHTFWAGVTVEATGAAEFAWEGVDEVVVTRVGWPGLNVNQLTAGFQYPLLLRDRPEYRFRWAFDLLDVYNDEPGTYTLPVSSGAQGVAESGAFLIWMRAKDGSQRHVPSTDDLHFFKQFNRVKQPCTVEVGEGQLTGELSCPRLETQEGEAITLRVTWRPATDEEKRSVGATP